MVSIGVMSPGRNDQSFEIALDLIAAGYVIVDISREKLDNKLPTLRRLARPRRLGVGHESHTVHPSQPGRHTRW